MKKKYFNLIYGLKSSLEQIIKIHTISSLVGNTNSLNIVGKAHLMLFEIDCCVDNIHTNSLQINDDPIPDLIKSKLKNFYCHYKNFEYNFDEFDDVKHEFVSDKEIQKDLYLIIGLKTLFKYFKDLLIESTSFLEQFFNVSRVWTDLSNIEFYLITKKPLDKKIIEELIEHLDTCFEQQEIKLLREDVYEDIKNKLNNSL